MNVTTSEKPVFGTSNAGPVDKEDEVMLRSTVDDDFEIGTTVATSSANVRLGFLRKVYGILAVQLAVTTAICALCMVQPIRGAVLAATGLLALFGIIATFGCIFALMVYKESYPLNMKLLAAFTVGESILVGTICAQYAAAGLGYLVLEALVITLTIFSSLTAYCLTSKKDFSFMGAGLSAALLALIGASFINLILGFTGGMSSGLAFIISWGGATLFSLFILYDTSEIMHRLSPDDFVIAAVSLYLDVVRFSFSLRADTLLLLSSIVSYCFR
jgi:protein lifeguard